MKSYRITIFGGSKPVPGEPAYEDALTLGKLLGEAGHTVLTGGYIGTMEAISRGAAEAGGHVIGVTCAEMEKWRPGKANRWVIEETRFETTRERLLALIDGCDAAFALPGGAGTLAEITVMWNNLITGSIEYKPLILIGAGWQKTFEAFYAELGEYVSNKDRQWLSFVSNPEDGVKLLEHLMERISKGTAGRQQNEKISKEK
jgi:uncharacterized protein (TIGR00730 family)